MFICLYINMRCSHNHSNMIRIRYYVFYDFVWNGGNTVLWIWKLNKQDFLLLLLLCFALLIIYFECTCVQLDDQNANKIKICFCRSSSQWSVHPFIKSNFLHLSDSIKSNLNSFSVFHFVKWTSSMQDDLCKNKNVTNQCHWKNPHLLNRWNRIASTMWYKWPSRAFRWLKAFFFAYYDDWQNV